MTLLTYSPPVLLEYKPRRRVRSLKVYQDEDEAYPLVNQLRLDLFEARALADFLSVALAIRPPALKFRKGGGDSAVYYTQSKKISFTIPRHGEASVRYYIVIHEFAHHVRDFRSHGGGGHDKKFRQALDRVYRAGATWLWAHFSASFDPGGSLEFKRRESAKEGN